MLPAFTPSAENVWVLHGSNRGQLGTKFQINGQQRSGMGEIRTLFRYEAGRTGDFMYSRRPGATLRAIEIRCTLWSPDLCMKRCCQAEEEVTLSVSHGGGPKSLGWGEGLPLPLNRLQQSPRSSSPPYCDMGNPSSPRRTTAEILSICADLCSLNRPRSAHHSLLVPRRPTLLIPMTGSKAPLGIAPSGVLSPALSPKVAQAVAE
jgi:hypothetical protein